MNDVEILLDASDTLYDILRGFSYYHYDNTKLHAIIILYLNFCFGTSI